MTIATGSPALAGDVLKSLTATGYLALATYLGDTADTLVTQGLVLNQGANDDNIVDFKSSDVAHGMTTDAETDTYGAIKKAVAADGGVSMWGYSEGTQAINLNGTGATEDTTKTTAAVGTAEIRTYKKSGTTRGAHGANANLVAFLDNDVCRFIFDAEGSGHADVEFTTFDDHDDLMALDQLQVIAGGSKPRLTPERYGGNSLDYNREKFEAMGIVGKDSWHEENGKLRSMVNMTKLSMLHHGAILQLVDRLLSVEEQNKQLLGILATAGLLPASVSG